MQRAQWLGDIRPPLETVVTNRRGGAAQGCSGQTDGTENSNRSAPTSIVRGRGARRGRVRLGEGTEQSLGGVKRFEMVSAFVPCNLRSVSEPQQTLGRNPMKKFVSVALTVTAVIWATASGGFRRIATADRGRRVTGWSITESGAAPGWGITRAHAPMW